LHNKLEKTELEQMEIVVFYLFSNAVFMGMDAGRGGCQHATQAVRPGDGS
jgi:hypothetical protein